GEQLVRELAPLAAHPNVREIRRYGAMVAVEFDDARHSKAAIAAALERDVLLITCGSHDQAVRFIPPLNISEADLRQGTTALVDAVRTATVPTPA
ncbi:MAG: aminotransferase class III-fold pyridoxal phosphate-dependent enzyme, partial [Chloroflexota bacterium]